MQTIRRITRGFCDKPGFNKLTGKPTNPDPRSVVDALARRDQLGLSDTVPARIVIHTDGRFKPLGLGGPKNRIKKDRPQFSLLGWSSSHAGGAGAAVAAILAVARRPAVKKRLAATFADPGHGAAIVDDLKQGLAKLPIWMQNFLRDLIIGGGANADQYGHQPAQTRRRGSEAAVTMVEPDEPEPQRIG